MKESPDSWPGSGWRNIQSAHEKHNDNEKTFRHERRFIQQESSHRSVILATIHQQRWRPRPAMAYRRSLPVEEQCLGVLLIRLGAVREVALEAGHNEGGVRLQVGEEPGDEKRNRKMMY